MSTTFIEIIVAQTPHAEHINKHRMPIAIFALEPKKFMDASDVAISVGI
ncbi:MAG TPA: hypothetical protein VLV88_00710 [Terriglobales bacterium]|nr:hypothetical protein [Terriglobales bacterium]